MIFKIFADKDTTITNSKARSSSTPRTGSNLGASEILEIFAEPGISGSAGYALSSSLSRAVIHFDLTSISELTSSSEAPRQGARYKLKLFDARHSITQPLGYNVDILPITSYWEEGAGIDLDNLSDLGAANWDKSTTSTLWATAGGDITGSMSSSYRFITGHEDLSVDITNIVNDWLTGSLLNNGLMIKIEDLAEQGSTKYRTKRFHSSDTNFSEKRPFIEMSWDDSIKDDRGIFLFDVENTLYLYNKHRGQLQDISTIGSGNDVLTVKISDLSGTIQTFSASHTGLDGIYSASITIPSASYSGSILSDKWSFAGVSYMTGTFTPHLDGAKQTNSQDEYVVKIMNKKKEYELNEVVKFNLFVRTRGYNPAIVQTGSLVIGNTVVEKAYYRIDNVKNGIHSIPLGTGSIETTRLSYDADGNYFKIYMSSLNRKELYKVVFFFYIDGQIQKLDEDIKFKVV